MKNVKSIYISRKIIWNKKIGESDVLITLATPRPYKNEEGEYDTDYIDVLLRGSVAKNTL